MEKFALTLQSAIAIEQYIADNRLMRYELELLNEMKGVIEKEDIEQLAWFASFGDSFNKILLNIKDYRTGLEFGFTEIKFNQYGWFASPKFLNFEEINLEKSNIRIGRGPNGIWAYALSCNYGTAGSSGSLCVYCKKFNGRNAALNAAIKELKGAMLSKIGHADRCNYHQDTISKTLKAIEKLEVGLIQLSLF